MFTTQYTQQWWAGTFPSKEHLYPPDDPDDENEED